MRQSQRDKRNYLIIGLCAVVGVMAVGFAAFSQQLTINSTSEVTSSWCVGFDTSKTNDYVATPGLTGATTPSATMSYSGNTCGSDNLQTGASLSATFKQPGDQVVYTFTIKNASTFNAKLDSISENLTTSNSAIEYELSGAKANDVLGPNDTTTLVVTVRYKNSVTSQPETTTWGLELKLNFSQTSDSPSGGSSGGGDSWTPPTEINGRTIDQTFVPQYYRYGTDYVDVGSTADTSAWTQDPTTLSKNYYLGHDVDSTTGNVTANYACFVINDTQYCMKSSSDGSTWNTNKALLGTLKDAGTITCTGYDNNYNETTFDNAPNAKCSGGGLGNLRAISNGNAFAGASDSLRCHAGFGISACTE